MIGQVDVVQVDVVKVVNRGETVFDFCEILYHAEVSFPIYGVVFGEVEVVGWNRPTIFTTSCRRHEQAIELAWKEIKKNCSENAQVIWNM